MGACRVQGAGGIYVTREGRGDAVLGKIKLNKYK